MKPIPTKSIAAPLGGALVLALAACVPQPRPEPAVETPPPAPPAPPPPPATVTGDWMDAAQTPGDWRYSNASGGGAAQFGVAGSEALFTMRCEVAARTVVLSRAGQTGATPRMTVRTESQTRALAASAITSARPTVESRLAASDRLLDAMALSKGRFAVEVPGTATLYLPSWAEVTRVIEDCR